MRRMQRVAIVVALAVGGLALLVTTLAVDAAPLAHTAAVRPFPGTTPCDTTLQACIDGLNPGDQINIAAGTYTESITLNKGVSLVGAGANATVLKALTQQRALTVTAAVTEGTVISGLTFQGNVLVLGHGGAVLVQAGAAPLLQNVVITGSRVISVEAAGGGLFTEASLTLSNVQFVNNIAQAGNGGGLASAPGIDLTLIDPTFSGNSAGLQGGGVYAGGSLTVTGGAFYGNYANDSAGALAVSGDLRLAGTVITGSQAFDSGGALFVTGQTTLHNALLAENRTTGGAGGALRAAGPVHISDSQLISNTSFNQGGALRGNSDVYLTNTTFISNVTTSNDAGAVDVIGDAYITGGAFIANATTEQGGGARVLGTLALSGTVFQGNTAGLQGGGLRVFTATVHNAVFEHNSVAAGNGGGIWAGNVLTVSQSTFRHNAVLSGTASNSTGSGGGIFGDGFVTSQANTFVENFAFRLGGGLDADDLVSARDVFGGNGTGPQGSGGAMFVSGVFTIDSGQFFTNTANTAGGLGVNSSAAGQVYNSLFAGNVVTFTDGGAAMRLLSVNSVTVTHNTFVGTHAPGKAAIFITNPGTRTFLGNLIAQHAVGLKTPVGVTVTNESTVFFSVTTLYLGAVITGPNDISGTVIFRDPAAGDYRLAEGSIAIDHAPDYGLPADFEGDPRPFGDGFDVGFDEVSPPKLFLPYVRKE